MLRGNFTMVAISMRSRSHSILMIVTLLSPALIGASLSMYDVNQLRQSYGGGGLPLPDIVPAWLVGFNTDLINTMSGWPILATLFELLTRDQNEPGFYMYSAIVWTLLLSAPLVLWAVYVGWWHDDALARRGTFVRSVAWIVAIPGAVLGLLAFVGAVIFIVLAAIVIYIAFKTFGGGSGAPETALDRDGRVFQKDRWSGEYAAKRGVFGEVEDTDAFGRPNFERGASGPKEKSDGPFQPSPRSADGERLYERKEPKTRF